MTDGKLVGKYSRILSPPDGWGWGGWGGDSPEAGSTAMSRGSLGDWATCHDVHLYWMPSCPFLTSRIPN